MRTPEGDEATQTEVSITQPFLPGITVGGVPLGHVEAFIRQYMSTLTAGFYIQLQPASSFATWSCLYSAIQTRLDFWLQHLTPEETEATCHTVDAELGATGCRRGPHLPWCYGLRGGSYARLSADLAPRLWDPLSPVACSCRLLFLLPYFVKAIPRHPYGGRRHAAWLLPPARTPPWRPVLRL